LETRRQRGLEIAKGE
jgi:hypothetical protein